MRSVSVQWQWLIIGVLALLVSGNVARAQSNVTPVYFPETGHFISREFRLYFEAQGGVPAFGHPITEPYIRASDGVIVQYFERSRFELIERAGQQPFIVLGNIGNDYITQQGLFFERVPPVPDTPTRRYFPETGHILQGVFKDYWDRNNGATYFGAPLSEQVEEVLPNGQRKTVQYFERARLELEANGTISRGLLGRALAPCQQQVYRPRNFPSSGPTIEGDSEDCANPDSIIIGHVFPASARPGSTFALEAINYRRGGEPVDLWLNRPDGSVRSLPYDGEANTEGYLLVPFEIDADEPTGRWSIVAKGIRTDRLLLMSFYVE
ncbi:MAG: hypothetical protein HC914_16480 [Chloroflexaceae bacterium]|nr:hypothetical protein [Chloroflexaceae bacterium]